MDTKRILTVIGTRPNFIKVTQFRKAASAYPGLTPTDLREVGVNAKCWCRKRDSNPRPRHYE